MKEPPTFAEWVAFVVLMSVVALFASVILPAVTGCLIYARAIVDGHYRCDPEGRVFDLLAQLGTLAGIAAGYLLRK